MLICYKVIKTAIVLNEIYGYCECLAEYKITIPPTRKW